MKNIFTSIFMVYILCASMFYTKENIFIQKDESLDFSDLEGVEFTFSSGAGAWSTILKINEDGTFSGYYHDSNAGESDENIYPFGTCYESNFYGQFSELTKIGEYEYTLKCEELNIEGVVDEENIVDGVKFITTEPYGVSKSDEFILYLPGKPASELTEIFMSWTNGKAKNGILESYGLYNVSGGYGFIVWEQGVNVKLKYNCK